MAFDLFGTSATTGRFVMVDEYDVCGGGIITTYTPTNKEDKIRDEVRHRNFNWVQSEIKVEERAYRNGHRAALILISGDSGVGKGKLARHLEEKLFKLNFQSYLLDRRNVRLGVSADIAEDIQYVDEETVRRFGEVTKLFLDAGHVVISTSNAFNQEQDSDIRLLAEPHPVIDISITDTQDKADAATVNLSLQEAQNEEEAANKIYHYLKDQKILTGHNYSI
jgi:bifunctional enzyme CysN/CysC